jgi:hypothetical protein
MTRSGVFIIDLQSFLTYVCIEYLNHKKPFIMPISRGFDTKLAVQYWMQIKGEVGHIGVQLNTQL